MKNYEFRGTKKGLHINSYPEFIYEFMENMNSHMNSWKKHMISGVPKRVCLWIHMHEFIYKFIFAYVNLYMNSYMKQIYEFIHEITYELVHEFICVNIQNVDSYMKLWVTR